MLAYREPSSTLAAAQAVECVSSVCCQSFYPKGQTPALRAGAPFVLLSSCCLGFVDGFRLDSKCSLSVTRLLNFSVFLTGLMECVLSDESCALSSCWILASCSSCEGKGRSWWFVLGFYFRAFFT